MYKVSLSKGHDMLGSLCVCFVEGRTSLLPSVCLVEGRMRLLVRLLS